MTNKEKTDYTRIGLGLCDILVNNMTAEVIWRTIEGIQKKKGKFSIRDAVDIKVLVEKSLDALTSTNTQTLEFIKTRIKARELSQKIKDNYTKIK